MKTILLAAERDLRTTGALSKETCQAFAEADEDARRGFEPSFAFLGCLTGSAAARGEVVPSTHRIEAVRLMMLRVHAHTAEPRWSSRMLDELFEAALRPPWAALGDIVHGTFAILGECPPGLSDTQAHFIREVGIYVVGKQRRAYVAEDFSWLVAAVTRANVEINAAQAYLATYTLPPSLVAACRDSIVRALRSTRFEGEVKRALDD